MRRLTTNVKTVEIHGECYSKIANSHMMPEFVMSLASSSDHWMFVSSEGALTAGRQNADNALFPYYSIEKITDTRLESGPKTIVRIENTDGEFLFWQPFVQSPITNERVVRNLYKNAFGNKLYFEEINFELGLKFGYRWTFSHRSGFVPHFLY